MSGEYLSSWLCSAGVNVSGMFVSDENECVCSAGVNVSGISVSEHTQCVLHIIRLRLIIFHTPKNFHGDFHFNFFL